MTKICQRAEEVPATFERYLERIMYLRKLSFECIQESTRHPLYNDIVIRYLVGNLHINLRPLWEPVIDVLKTHANERNRQPFWSVFVDLLKIAFQNTGAVIRFFYYL